MRFASNHPKSRRLGHHINTGDAKVRIQRQRRTNTPHSHYLKTDGIGYTQLLIAKIAHPAINRGPLNLAIDEHNIVRCLYVSANTSS